ncbi:Squalene synthase [Zancudomyces culisetae]|uniref:Squalene synthase n=1 Tax=Zancudomyces culisetae TaxID=1213189 RepID=A0A1R1PU91_ZANCU|nr:Squalene synthase [Zancudomyces culisetae]|eukprot:OMH84472.1 Squalene synthase [Zancudomyces culisetae]
MNPEEVVTSVLYLLRHASAEEKIQKLKCSSELIRCYQYLEQTSRSFAAVIQELHPELKDVICIYYLVLRGLDTVEDDMTLEIKYKKEVLETFYEKLYIRGWSFADSGPNEEDAPLLIEFDVVITEFLNLKKEYQDVIAKITREMGMGMSKYTTKKVNTVEDWNEYCHYVAGLVGIGLSQLFVASGLEPSGIEKLEALSNSMGLFLQKTNIIRDVFEDVIDDRRFWPIEVWSKHVNLVGDLINDKYLTQGVNCLNELCLNAIEHIPDVLDYLSQIHDRTIFSFCAIPQTMAIATITLCLNNPKVMSENVKIRKTEAIRVMKQKIAPTDAVFLKKLDILEKNVQLKTGPSMANSKYEYVRGFETFEAVLPMTFMVVRLDGQNFTKFSADHGFEKPNDIKALELMNFCAQRIMSKVSDIIFSYGQSDEYRYKTFSFDL